MPPSISVVIPTHDRRDQVLAAVGSALAQTFPPREVIVVDDGSSDGTAQAVRSAHPPGGRVRVLRLEENGGACRARNAGIAASGGDWVAFLDSDDGWRPEKLARQVEALAGVPGAVASFTGILWLRPGTEPRATRPPHPLTLGSLFAENALGSTSTALVSRLALDRVGGFDASLPSCQDWDLWLRLLAIGPAVAVPDPLTLYDDGLHERISRSPEKVLSGNREVFRRVLGMIDEPGLKARVRAAHLAFEAHVRATSGHHARAAVLAARSWCQSPGAGTGAWVLPQAVAALTSAIPGPVRRPAGRVLRAVQARR